MLLLKTTKALIFISFFFLTDSHHSNPDFEQHHLGGQSHCKATTSSHVSRRDQFLMSKQQAKKS
jgi:hypothetical protein